MKRLLLLFVLVCLNITIALAQVTTDSRVNNASVISAPNGIIVIDIAKPDSNGLSNNTYTDFNIPTEGVIFNNNISQGRSKLAGVIFGNSNYNLGDAAHLILNQVTSNNSSSLEGFGEVFGSKAGVIIANPNGITCTGCGFINASRVDLVTGTNQFDSNNNLTGFSINQYGKVRIIGKGFNGSEVNYLNLVSRYHDIQAQITAQTRLRILSGNQTYNSNNFTITSNTNTGSGFAVDISALANLQSDSIVIVGTEAGLGINSQGNLISIMQNVEIDSAGRIILNKITSLQDILLKSTAEITTTADSYLKAGGDVNIDAKDISLNSVLAYGNFTASTDGDFSNSSILRAENFDLRAFTSTLGDITADGNFSLRTQSNTIISGDLAVLGDAVIETNNLSNSGNIYANSLSIVVDDDFSNYKNTYTSSLDIISKSFFNEGSISANRFNVLARDSFINSLGSIHSSALDIITASFRNENQATITTNNLFLNLNENFTSDNSNFQNVLFNNLELIAANNTIHNSVDLSADNLIFVVKNLTNSAKLHSNNLDITAYDSFDNAGIGGIQTNNFNLTVGNDFYNDAFHPIRFENLVLTASSDFYNNADIISDSLSITAGGNVYNNANITANDLDLKTKKNFYNNAKLTANFLILATSSDFDNRGDIQANILGLEVGEDFTNSSANIISDSIFITAGGSFDNNANITANDLDLKAEKNFYNNAKLTANFLTLATSSDFYNRGDIQANNFSLTGVNFDNIGDIQANILNITVTEDFKNIGNIYSNNFSFITNSFENDVSASIQAIILDFTADEVTNKGSIQADYLNIYSNVAVNNRGSLRANNFSLTGVNFDNTGDIEANILNITVTEDFKNIGNIYSNNFNFITNSFENDVSASIQAIILDFTADVITNKGSIQADYLNIYSTLSVNNRGSLQANNLYLTADNFYNQNNASISASTLDVNAYSLNNQSDAEINAKNFITNSIFISNYGEITADNFNIITDDFTNIDSAKISASTLDINTGYFTNTDGAIISVNNLNINAGVNFDNTGDIFSQNLVLNSIYLNNYGKINASTLDVNAYSLNNQSDAEINAKNFITNSIFISNYGEITADNFNIITDDFTNIDSAKISASTLDINTGYFTNTDGAVISVNNLTINAGVNFDNTGDIFSQNLVLNSIYLNNYGKINASTLAINAYSLNNQSNAEINVKNFITNSTFIRNYGEITADYFNIITDDFANIDSAKISASTLDINAGYFTNTYGAAISVNNLSVSADYFINTNRATISVNNLNAIAGSFINYNDADISVNNLSINASYFYNDANIDASEGTILTLNFQNLASISANALSITVFDDGTSDDTTPNGFENSGNIRVGSLNLTIANNFYNYRGGDIQVGSLYLTASGDYNYGKISASTIDILVNDFYNDAGGIIQTGSLRIDATGSFDNRGNISTDSLYLNYDTYSNTGSIVTGDSFNQTISNIIIDTPIIPTISTIDIADITDIVDISTVDIVNIFTVAIADISAVDTIVFSIPTVTIDIPIVSTDTATIPVTPQNLSYSYTAPNFNSLATFDIQPLAEKLIYDIESRIEFYEFSEITAYGSTTALIYQPYGRDIQVINIAKPDANGLSNNSYSSFHIPSQGIIFNNSNVLGISALAGAIFKNSNYSNTDSASLILNQITSNNISFLEGYAEVFGDEAGIIIANPNGIICSGCGFFNTNRVDLITGTSNFNSSGEITNFNIDNYGKISIHEGFALIKGEVIQRAGLDEASIDYLNLVSRYHSIQAQITAKERIQILSGNHNYDYTNSIVGSTTATNSADGEFAVDISALGNIQAGSIFFKATEAGLGIHSNGNFTSSVTGVSIDSAGKLHLGSITSTQDIRLNSTAEITTSSNSVFQARKNIDVKATDITLNSILTQEDFNVNADGIFESNSDIRARNFSINSQAARLGGDITIDNKLNLITQANTSLIGNLAVLGDIHITADSYNQSGRLHTNQNLYLTLQNSASFDPNSILNSSQFMLKAANFYNSGNLNVSTLDIQTTYEIQNNGGAISANILSIIASDLDNQNKANISASTLDITITNIFQNKDSAIRANDFYLTAAEFYNQNGASISASTLNTTITNIFQNDNADIRANYFYLTADEFYNQNNASISASTLNTTITNRFQNNDSDIRANNFYLTADEFYNQNNASISASTLDITLTNTFQNDNADIRANDFYLTADEFYNQNNAIISASTLATTITNTFQNKDSDIRANYFYLTADEFYNQNNASISASTLDISINNTFQNKDSDIRANNFYLTADEFYNQSNASINASTLDITINNTFQNNDSDIRANYFYLTADEFYNQSNASISASTLDITINNTFQNNDSDIRANDFYLTADEFYNQNNASISASTLDITLTNTFQNNNADIRANDFYLTADEFYNQNNAIISASTLDTTITNIFQNDNADIRANDFYLTADEFYNQNNASISASTLDTTITNIFQNDNADIITNSFILNTNSFNNQNNASISSANALDITTDTFQNDNTADIIANNFNLNTNSFNNQNNASISSANALDITTDTFQNDNTADIIANNFNLNTNSFSNQNNASISSANALDITTDTFQNDTSAEVITNNFNLNTNSFSNQNNASINSANNFNLSADSFSNLNQAKINTNNFNLNTNSFSNQNNASIISANALDITITNNTFQNNDSEIRANDFYLTADDFYNQNNASISARTLATTITNRFQNDNADIITNSFNLNTNSFSNQNNASISSANNFNLNTNSFNNQDNASISSANNFNLNTNSFSNQDNATIYAFESEFIIAGDFANEANIYGNKANITAANLDNKGIIGFAEDLTLSVTNNVTNYNEIQTGGRLTIESNYFTNNSTALVASHSTTDIQTTENFINKGAIYSFTDLILTAGVSTDGVTYFKSNDFLNERGWIEANRNLEIHSNNITNKANVESWIYEYGPQGEDNWDYKQIENPELEANRGRVYSGGDMKLIANEDISNEYSYIRSNGDLTIEGNDFYNSSTELILSEAKNNRTRERDRSSRYACFNGCPWGPWQDNWSQVITSIGQVASIVDVGGNISGKLKNKFTNGEVTTGDVPDLDLTIDDSSTNYEDKSEDTEQFEDTNEDTEQFEDTNEDKSEDTDQSEDTNEDTDQTADDQSKISQFQTTSTDILDLEDIEEVADYQHTTPALLLASSPLFTIATPSADRKYTIETRLVFIDLSKFFGSEYFFKEAGFDPNEHAEVLGDAFWEQQHILEEITRLAASAYLADNSLSSQEIMKLLLDGAIEVKDELDLIPGVTLTKEQTDRLTKDIVWYVEEEITINGVTQKYLVPRLYLAKVTRAEIDEADGSIISARNVDIIVEGNLQETMDEEENALIDKYLAKNSAKKIAADVQAILTDANVGVVKLNVNDRRLENQLSPEQSIELDGLIETELEQALQDFNFATTSKILNFEDEIESLEKEIETIEARRYQNSGRNKNLNQNQISNSIRSKWKKVDELRQKIDKLTTTKFDTESYTNLIKKSYLTTLDRRGQLVNSGTIRARDELIVHAGNHINSSGNLKAGTGGIYLTAIGNVNIFSNYTESDFGDQIYGKLTSNATLNTKGDLHIIAGQDINITAADLNVEQNANLTATTGNLTIESIGVRNKRTSYSGSTTIITDEITHQRSSINIGKLLTTHSGGNTTLRGAELKAGAAKIHAEGSFSSIAVYDTTSRTTIHENSGNWIKGGSTTTKNWSSGKALGNSIETIGELSISGNKGIYLQSTKFKAGKDGKRNIYITSNEGQVVFDTATEWDSHSSKKEGKGALWRTDNGHGHNGTTEKDNDLKGNINLYAKNGVELTYVKQEVTEQQTYIGTCYKQGHQGENIAYSCNKTRTITRFETEAEAKARLQEERGWQSQIISQGSNTTLTSKANTYEDWDYNNSGLTEEAALAVSIAVSAATGGVGGAILGSGISSLASIGAVNLINAIGRGNNLNDALHETTRNTLTEENLKNAAVAVIAAGVTYGIDVGVDKWGGGSDFAKNYAGSYSQKIINTTVNTAVHSLADRKTLREFGYSLEDAYKTLAIDTAAENGANWIGDKYVENRKQDVWESGGLKTNSASTYIDHKVLHALLGCAVGAAKAGDCQSGAAGAVIGEIVGEAIVASSIKDGEFSQTDEWLAKTVGTTAAIFGTSALGGDFNVASDTAENAIDNNALWLLDYLFSAEELGNAELYPEEKEEEENQDEITEAILTAGAIAKCVTKAKGCLNILKKKPKDKPKTQGLERELKEHRQRLEDYKKNPDKVDNQGYLRNAGNNQELRQEIINDRIRRLEGQIKNFEKQIRDIKSKKKIQTPKSKVK